MDSLNTPALPLARGWHRPVRPVALLGVGAVVLVVWLLWMVAVFGFVYTQLDVRVALADQPVALRLPEGLAAKAELQQPLRTRLDLRPRLQVPVRQTLSVEVSDSLQAQVQTRTSLSVDTVVHVDQRVPVRTTLQLKVPVVSWLPAFDLTLPVAIDVPVQMDVPVKVQVPVQFDALVSGEFRQPLRVPLDAVFTLRPEVRSDLQVQVARQMDFALREPVGAIAVRIEQARLHVPFDVPTLHRREAGHPLAGSPAP